MSKRILMFGSLVAVLIGGVMLNLSILDIVTGPELRETLGKSLAVVGVSTSAILLIGIILKAGRTTLRAEPTSREHQETS